MTLKTAQELFSPTSVSEFIEKYLEEKVLLLQRESPESVEGLFDLDSLGECLGIAQPFHANTVRIVPKEGGEQTSSLSGLSGREAIGMLIQAFASGSTLVLNSSEQYWPPIRDLCADLHAELACTVRCNIYCTPPHSQGFDTHVDGHDVLVLQTYGTKTWRIHEVIDPLPIEESALSREFHSTLKENAPDYGEPTREVVLKAGDLLYLPRGVPHSAASTDDSSIHFTIGLYPIRTHAFLGDLVDMIAHRDVRLRQRIAYQSIKGEAPLPSAGDMLREVAAIADALDDPVDTNQLVKISSEGDPPMGDLNGAFLSASLFDAIHTNTTVARPRGTTFTSRENANEIKVFCGAGSMALPHKLKEVIPFLVEHEEFRIGDISDELLSDKSKVVLVRNLMKNGLLRIVDLGETPPMNVQSLQEAFSF